ncbi:hypothetical protein RND81_12G205100 [Saponaria officinalis]|uniref:Uncharacterized protein n=1 Tax=Saponaria officinalis TaxID=3572 RepID=A0AAW1HD92_SAPOF
MKSNLNNHLMILLIISSLIMLGNSKGGSLVAKPCPDICLDVAYVTCPSSGNQQLLARCNCCMTSKGCILHLSNGGSQIC